jgi:hypothetical protein
MLYASSQSSYRQMTVPSSFLTNVTFSTKPVWGGWELSASCYNVMNRRWLAPGGPEVLQAAIPQDGRTYRFQMTYRLHAKEAQSK